MKAEAVRIVDEIIQDILCRKGIGNEWENIDEKTRVEIRETWISIAARGSDTEPVDG